MGYKMKKDFWSDEYKITPDEEELRRMRNQTGSNNIHDTEFRMKKNYWDDGYTIKSMSQIQRENNETSEVVMIIISAIHEFIIGMTLAAMLFCFLNLLAPSIFPQSEYGLFFFIFGIAFAVINHKCITLKFCTYTGMTVLMLYLLIMEYINDKNGVQPISTGLTIFYGFFLIVTLIKIWYYYNDLKYNLIFRFFRKMFRKKKRK